MEEHEKVEKEEKVERNIGGGKEEWEEVKIERKELIYFPHS